MRVLAKSVESSSLLKQISNSAFPRFFSAVLSLFILAVLFLDLDLRQLIFGKDTKETLQNGKIIQALLENAEPVKGKKRDTVRFLSDKDSEARGKITKEKGFESISTDYVLSPGEMAPLQGRILSSSRMATILTSKEGRTRIAISEKKPTQEATQSADRLRIPAYYRFRHDFALSWDNEGNPAIPTARYEHYSYFRSMINKIQSVWAPPGGDPYPTFGDSYHRLGYASGYMRFSTFPSQDIYIQFLLDENGVVKDAKLVSSLGFQSLDRSCIEALYAAHDFGPVPKALLDGSGVLIVPFIFRIIVR